MSTSYLLKLIRYSQSIQSLHFCILLYSNRKAEPPADLPPQQNNTLRRRVAAKRVSRIDDLSCQSLKPSGGQELVSVGTRGATGGNESNVHFEVVALNRDVASRGEADVGAIGRVVALGEVLV